MNSDNTNPTTTPTLDEALRLAALGWRVFPLAPGGKQPIPGCKWKEQATTDPERIASWWAEHSERNIAIVPPAGVLVVDVDDPDAVDDWVDTLSDAPMTRTPRGGCHLYVGLPGGMVAKNSVGQLADRVDVRTAGGYVVAPPSTTGAGSWSWARCLDGGPEGLPVAPAWLLDRLRSLSTPTSPTPSRTAHSPASVNAGTTAYGRKALDAESADVANTPEGGRNDRLNTAAFKLGRLVGGGELDRSDAERELHAAAHACRLGEAEASKTIRSGLDKGVQHPRTRAERVDEGVASAGVVGPGESEPEALTWEPFPIDALPPVVGDYCNAVSEAISVDPATVAVLALGVLGGCVGTARRIKPKESWSEPGIIWAAISQRSGDGKSPAMDAVIGHLRTRQSDEWAAYKSACERAKLQGQGEGLSETDLSAVLSTEDEHGTFPPANAEDDELIQPARILASDATTEALLQLLADHPRGLLVEYDELSGWLGGLDRYRAGGRGGSDRAIWLAAHGGRPHTVDRKTTGQTMIRACALSLVGAIQPSLLHEMTTEADEVSGLLPRLLIAEPPTPGVTWTEATIPEDLHAAWTATLDSLLGLHPDDPHLGPKPGALNLSPEAKDRWVWFFNASHLAKHKATDDATHARWSKWVGYAARLALIFELVERVDESPHQHTGADGYGSVRDSAMQGAIMVTNWFAREWKRIKPRNTEPVGRPLSRDAQEAHRWLKTRGEPLPASELAKSGPAKLRKAEKANAAMDELEQAGRVRKEPKPGGLTFLYTAI